MCIRDTGGGSKWSRRGNDTSRSTSARRRLRQECLIECERRKVSVLTDCHFGSAYLVGPFDVGDAVTIYRFLCGKIFLEVVICGRSNRHQIAVLRSRGVSNVKVL